MAKKAHLSRRSIRWKSKTNNGDLCKYYVHEIIGKPKQVGGRRPFAVICRILTKTPHEYPNNPTVLRLFCGKALIQVVESHAAESWLLIGNAVGALMGNKNNDK